MMLKIFRIYRNILRICAREKVVFLQIENKSFEYTLEKVKHSSENSKIFWYLFIYSMHWSINPVGFSTLSRQVYTKANVEYFFCYQHDQSG